ncbi:unnamed protein product [Brachionus calyciflorus]|uniref:Uncharacterized protein n=1 Tax=Brachionus calyciflorus TaxID=104777 RepID=A0A813WPY4_9BILA|nr:unnamed protein product [Brachionus calyciflorus]
MILKDDREYQIKSSGSNGDFLFDKKSENIQLGNTKDNSIEPLEEAYSDKQFYSSITKDQQLRVREQVVKSNM